MTEQADLAGTRARLQRTISPDRQLTAALTGCLQRFWAKIKEWRAIATRYEKTANSFTGVLCLAAALDWIKN